MDINQQKEQFSGVYLRAVATVAGFALYKPEVDDDSVDWGIAQTGGGGTVRSPRVELQVKCTSRDLFGDSAVSYPLKLKNYEDLRHTDFVVPRILVVVVVPEEPSAWLTEAEDALALHHCGYWMSLRGLPATENQSTVAVRLPRSQPFTVAELQNLMSRVRGGGYP